MMPSNSDNQKRPLRLSAPVPRDCVSCAQREVYPETTSLETEERYEDQMYPLVLENFSMPVCRACGSKIYTEVVDREINRRFREYLGLLSPEQIRAGIETLNTTPRRDEQAARDHGSGFVGLPSRLGVSISRRR